MRQSLEQTNSIPGRTGRVARRIPELNGEFVAVMEGASNLESYRGYILAQTGVATRLKISRDWF